MTEYEQLQKSRMLLQAEMASGGVEDLSGDPGEGVGEQAIRQARPEMPPTAPAQPSGLEKAGAATTTAGMAGGNPYVAGAGLALQTLGQVDSAKRAQEQAKIKAYNDKIMAQRQAVRNMFA